MSNSHSQKLWWWVIIAVVIVCAVLSVDQLLLKRQKHAEVALLSGQRVELDITQKTTTARVRNSTLVAEAESAAAVPTVEVELLLVGLGLSPDLMETALTLPKEVALGLTAHSPTLEYWIHHIRQQGRFFYVEMPLHLGNDTGPINSYDIASVATPSEQVERVKRLFARADGRKGGYITIPSGFEQYHGAYDSLFRFLSARKIPIIYAIDTLEHQDLFANYQFTGVQRYIRNDSSASLMFHQLREVVGKEMAEGQPRRVMIEAGTQSLQTLKHWLRDIESKEGVVLRPLSHTQLQVQDE